MGREIFLRVGRRGGGCVRERQGDGEAGSGFRGGRVTCLPISLPLTHYALPGLYTMVLFSFSFVG